MELQNRRYYHIYNRGINSQTIFRKSKDYRQFLKSYHYYNFLSLDTFAYCLLSNHFHFLVRVRSIEEQKKLFLLCQKENSNRYHTLKYSTFKPLNGSYQLGHLFNSYTSYFNRCYDVTGPLLEGSFKRIEVDSEEYRNYLIGYIHRNPIHHRLVDTYADYQWSSYHHFVKDRKNRRVNITKVLQWFGGLKGFKAAHDEVKLKIKPKYLLE